MSSSSSSSQTGKLIPHLDARSTKMLNLTVLQRIDPCIEEILITAAHVTFYEFNVDLNQWSRKDIEGSLFVVKRTTQPRFRFVVMNRRNTENLVEDLLGDFEFEIQVPYLLYRSAAQEVNGIWFYNSHECEEVANLFSRILCAYSEASPNPQLSSTKSEFEVLESAPTSAVIEEPLEPSFPIHAHTEVPEDSSSFMNFFNAATSIGSNSANITNTRQPGYSSAQTVYSTSHVPGPQSSPLSPSTLQFSALRPSAPLIPSMSVRDGSDPTNKANQVSSLVKPSTFFTPQSSPALLLAPISSSISTPAVHPPLNLHRPHDAPMLQHFPPPSPTSNATPSNAPLDREKIRDALIMLVQDNQFIDLVHQALSKVHKS
nr:mRNA-decapping enzyme-like protein [Ipomoea batatas]